MNKNPNVKIYTRMALYTFLTILITFFSLIDTLDVTSLGSITQMEWIKLISKSLVTGLISLKAFLDDTINNKKEEEITEEKL